MWLFGRGLGPSREAMLRGVVGTVVVGRGVTLWTAWRFMSSGLSEVKVKKGEFKILPWVFFFLSLFPVRGGQRVTVRL